MSVRILKKALKLSAFFFIGITCVANTAVADCAAQDYDAAATVLRVIDGDTLVLTDKRKVRLLGINAPELKHYPKPAEPFALRAKQFVEASLSFNKKIYLKYGRQKTDPYGRVLAHIFLPDGQNLNAMILAKGLASAVVVPPNVHFNQCYFRLEQRARLKPENIWSDIYFQYLDANKTDTTLTGFRFIKGKVKRIGRSRDSIWLQLASTFTLRIKRKDYKYISGIKFESLTLEQLANKMLFVRGWVYKWKGEQYMQLRHSQMMNIAEVNHQD